MTLFSVFYKVSSWRNKRRKLSLGYLCMHCNFFLYSFSLFYKVGDAIHPQIWHQMITKLKSNLHLMIMSNISLVKGVV